MSQVFHDIWTQIYDLLIHVPMFAPSCSRHSAGVGVSETFSAHVLPDLMSRVLSRRERASRLRPVPSRSRRSEALHVACADNVETNFPLIAPHHVKTTRNLCSRQHRVCGTFDASTTLRSFMCEGWLAPASDENRSMPEQSALAKSTKCRLAPRAEEGTIRKHLDPRDAGRGELGCDRCHTAGMDSPWSPTKDTIFFLSTSAQVQWIFLAGYRGDESWAALRILMASDMPFRWARKTLDHTRSRRDQGTLRTTQKVKYGRVHGDFFRYHEILTHVLAVSSGRFGLLMHVFF